MKKGFTAFVLILKNFLREFFSFPKGEPRLLRACRFLWWAICAGMCTVVIIVLAIIFNWFNLTGEIPSLKAIENPQLPEPSVLYTSDSVEIGRFYSQNKTPVHFEDIDSMTINALLATEDIRFNRHSGIDARATFSIAWYLMKGDNRGGSTLSQQLAKNMFDMRTAHKGKISKGKLATVIAKAKEWILAIRIERNYTKEEILTMYFNEVSFGNNATGLHAAAKKYFSTSPDSLDIHQSALLVGLLQAPSTYNPISRPQKATKRRNIVLAQMKKYGYLTEEQKEYYQQKPLDLDIYYETLETGGGSYFKQYATQKLKEWCEENGYDLYADGLRIYLTIDSKLQKHAEDAIAKQLPTYQETFNQEWSQYPPWSDKYGKTDTNYIPRLVKKLPYYEYLIQKYGKNNDSVQFWLNQPKTMSVFTWENESRRKEVAMSTIDSLKYYRQLLRAGLLSLDPFTGHIKAWVGGIDYEFFKYDQVYQAKRQPGSTFKVFVYTAAIDSLNMSPCDTILDTNPIIRYNEGGEEKTWTPHNADWVASGRNMTLRHAMGRSINTVTAKLTEKVTPQAVAIYAKKMGITSPLAEVPSIGLGSNEVSLFDMVGAYATIQNQGIWQEPQILWHIKDKHDNTINYFYNKSHRALSRESAWLMSYMLRGGAEEPHGTSLGLWSYGVLGGINQVGGKTGTTSDFADGWYMGVTRDLVTGVWVGGEDRMIRFRSSKTGEGSKTALPVFGEYMKSLYEDKTSGIYKAPFLYPSVEIKRPYYCPTSSYERYPEKDSTDSDLEKTTNSLLDRIKSIFKKDDN